ncbi:MAG: AAA family ATPase, partial [Candidatus Aerophobetes bacterium]|nr:AAA family ATPase [Candidatus Aerophobetes bacterium]
MVTVPGLRGVGKTTLFAQIFFYLYPQFSENILYLPVDELVNILESDLYSALQEYEKILGNVFERTNRKVFILIDEIHYDKKWPSVLKSIFDRSKNVFMLCTGSSALSLQTKNADIARRVVFEKLCPMDFTEYLLLKSQSLHSRYKEAKIKSPIPGLKSKIKEAIFDSSDAKSCYSNLKKLEKDINRYWMDIDRLEIDRYLKFGTMPFAIKVEEEQHIYNFINELINRVIEKDIIDLGRFNIDTVKKIKSILLMVASSDKISVTNLAKNIGNISVNTLIDIFDVLEKAEVL